MTTSQLLNDISNFLDEINKDLLDASLIRNKIQVDNLLESSAKGSVCYDAECEYNMFNDVPEEINFYPRLIVKTKNNIEALQYSVAIRGDFDIVINNSLISAEKYLQLNYSILKHQKTN